MQSKELHKLTLMLSNKRAAETTASHEKRRVPPFLYQPYNENAFSNGSTIKCIFEKLCFL